jgi:SAM-dependent methyltransferase
MMTQLPSDEEIEKLKLNNFSNLRSTKKYIDALFNNKDGLKIIDYGSSWGYDVFRYAMAGHQAVGYELSKPRANFGMAKLGVKIYSDLNLLPVENDLIISSHVIEHLSRIQDFISLSKKLLKKDGIFIAFCPNGNAEYKKREHAIWHVNWGAVHPNSLSTEFAQYAFRENPYLILTGDWAYDENELKAWDGKSQKTGSYKEGKELLIISKPNLKIN